MKELSHTYRHVKGFSPVTFSGARVLILGSVPSVKSVEAGFYYMHPQNRFWKILSAIFKKDFVGADVTGKIELLKEYKIALNDVIYECDVIGSADATIKNVVPIDLAKILKNTEITHIFTTGKTAHNLFIKYFGKYAEMETNLPSPSPANAVKSLQALTEEYGEIKKILREKL